jgi:hypothetical protein
MDLQIAKLLLKPLPSGSPGFDADGKLSMMYLKGFGKLETATPMAAIKESMAAQAKTNASR